MESESGNITDGAQVRRQVLGTEFIDRAQQKDVPLMRPFREFAGKMAWQGVWTRDRIDLQARSLLTVAILAALGREEELAMHLRGAANLEVPEAALQDALLQVAAYAGLPAAHTAFKLAAEVYGGDAPQGAAPPMTDWDPSAPPPDLHQVTG